MRSVSVRPCDGAHRSAGTGSRFVECGAPDREHLNGTGHDALVLIHHSADPCRDLPAVLALPVNPATGPQLCIHLIRTSGNDTLCITVHHAAMDARGLLACTRFLAECYRSSGYSTVPQAETMDRSLAAVLSPFPESARICDWPAPEDPPAGWAFPVGSGGGGTRDFALRTLPASSLDAVKRAGNLQEATVNDVLLAAYFLALCRTIGPHRAARCQLWYPLIEKNLNDPLSLSQKDMICNQSVAFAIHMKPARSHWKK